MKDTHPNQFTIQEDLLFDSMGITARSYRYESTNSVMHCHRFLEFEYVVSGYGVHYINDRKIELSPGDYFGIGLEDFHRYEVHEVEMRNLIISPSYTTHDIQSLLSSRSFPIYGNIPVEKREQVEALFHMVDVCYHSTSAYKKHRLPALTMALLTDYLEYAEQPESIKVSGTYQHIRNALQYVNTNSHLPLTIQETAKAINVSSSYLSTIFYRYVGCHFSEYLNRTRLKNACILLADTGLPITEVAAQTGFTCISTMNRAFLRHQGISPSEYRKQRRKINNNENG